MRGTNFYRGLAVILIATAAVTAISQKSLMAANSATYDESSLNASKFELLMWHLINSDRQDQVNVPETNGRANPLTWDDRLAVVARQHSLEMAQHNYFSHEGLDGSMPWVRVSAAGIHWRSTAENIAEFSNVAEAEAAFMNEPRFQHNHRGNILNPAYNHVGVGIVRGPDGMFYITQDFAGF